jgi:hypothetical protein
MKQEKHGNLLLKLVNSVQSEELDFTLKKCKFLIMDTLESGNGQVLTEQVLLENMHTLKDKPIVAKYFKVVDGEDDHLGDHEQFLSKDRDGKDIIETDTAAIGHFTSGGYIEMWNDVPSLFCDGVLYAEKYPDVIALLQEWLDKGIQINSSVEYYYANYEFKDGVEYINSPVVMSAFAILNSEARGDSKVIDGAYSAAQLLSMNMKQSWNKALSNINTKITESEGEKMEGELTKVINELSLGGVVAKLYDLLYKTMTADEFNRISISDYNVYADYFVYSYWNGDNYDYFDVSYSVSDTDEVTVDLEGKTKVEKVWDWKAVSNQLEEVQSQLNEASEKLVASEAKIEELSISINAITEEKTNLETSLNTKEAELISVNEKMISLNEIAEKVKKDEHERKLANALETYKEKFTSVNAIERFETEEIQNLIKDSIDNADALLSLNNLIVELIPVVKSANSVKDNTSKPIMGKTMNHLIPDQVKTLESKYFN